MSLTIFPLCGTSRPTLGCDPELFFTSPDGIIGSEQVLAKNDPRVVVDGVQAELHPSPSTCRETLANSIGSCLASVRERLNLYTNLTVSFAGVVDVKEEEFQKLSPKAKRLGCAPSLNAYPSTISLDTMDTSSYRTRSAGGHIHLGIYAEPTTDLIKLFDILVGGPCVLLDRNPLQKERRKLYGRAGEYRKPSYGLEYRTLSNFWLQAYPLMSLVMGMSRNVIGIYSNAPTLAKAFLDSVDIEEVRTSINENDFDLAWKNWEKIRVLMMHVQVGTGLNTYNLGAFETLVTKGVDHFFPQDPLAHWQEVYENGADDVGGWENFASSVQMGHIK